jgi:hypothetical protein
MGQNVDAAIHQTRDAEVLQAAFDRGGGTRSVRCPEPVATRREKPCEQAVSGKRKQQMQSKRRVCTL